MFKFFATNRACITKSGGLLMFNLKFKTAKGYKDVAL